MDLFCWRNAVANAEGPVNPTTRHVLLTLSLHMDEAGGSCFPSTRTVAERTGLSRRTVEKHLAAAEAEGWIRRRRGAGDRQGWRRIEYAAALPEKVGKEIRHVAGEGGEPASPRPAEGGEPRDTKVGNVVRTNSSVNSSSIPSDRTRSGPGRGDYPEAFEELWAAYPRNPNDSKKAGWRKYQARLRAGVSHQEMLDGVRRYAAQVEALGTEPDFVKHLKTFLGPNEYWKLPYPIRGRGNGSGSQRDPLMMSSRELLEQHAGAAEVTR